MSIYLSVYLSLYIYIDLSSISLSIVLVIKRRPSSGIQTTTTNFGTSTSKWERVDTLFLDWRRAFDCGSMVIIIDNSNIVIILLLLSIIIT